MQFKSGDSYLRHRKRDGAEVIDVRNERHADYWQRHEDPVMLVIRGSDEKIRWMNVTEYLKLQGTESKQIVFEGEPFTAVNVRRQWLKVAGSR